MENSSFSLLGWLAGIGAAIGLGQLLLSDEPITWRRVVGRALVTGGLALGAAAALVWIPGLPFPALAGIAAATASLGTSGLERLFQKFINRGQP